MSQGVRLTASYDHELTNWKVNVHGNITHCATASSNVYIYGEIQHHWFYNQVLLTEKLNKNQYNKEFYQQLNGHFSLVIIDKNNGKLRVVANRSGGCRLYIKQCDDKLIISDRLSKLLDKSNKFSTEALPEIINFRWNSGEHSILQGIRQLPSACYWDFIATQLMNKCCYQYFSINTSFSNDHIEDKANDVASLLSLSMKESIAPNSRVAVLLSGGVDSSVLAALASKFQENLVAISHQSDDQQNPELETAIQFAQELGIEHQIYTINNDEILDAFINTAAIIEQPARYQSSLILYKLFEKMTGKFDQIIYGEAADTLFGSSLVKRYKLRYKKQKTLHGATQYIPFAKAIINFLPENNRWRQLYNESVNEYLLSSSQLEYGKDTTLIKKQFSLQPTDLLVMSRLIAPQIAHEKISTFRLSEAKIKSYLMRTDRDNHFHETGALAAKFNMTLISPFVDYRIVEYASTLTDADYYGESFIKPVLRKIGESYFTPSLMYLNKKGFPAPYESWITGPLSALWTQVKEELVLPDESDHDTEYQWTMMCLQQVAKQLNIQNKFK